VPDGEKMLNCLSFYLRGRGHLYMYVRPSLLLESCPAEPFSYLCVAEPLRTGKSQLKSSLFRTERRAKTDFPVPSRWYSKLQKVEGLSYSYSS
jgi:hypothetical protein